MRVKSGLLMGLVLLLTAGCGAGTTSLAARVAPLSSYDAQDTIDPVGPMPARFAEVVNTHQDLIFRGGVPNDDHLKVLLETGVDSSQVHDKVRISAIVNLLDPTGKDGPSVAHEKAVAKAHHVTFVNLSLPWGIVPPTKQIQLWFSTVEKARKSHTAVYIHCTHGRDRTGSMVAAYREQYDAWEPTKALDEMEGTPFGYDPKPYPWITQFVQDFEPIKM